MKFKFSTSDWGASARTLAHRRPIHRPARFFAAARCGNRELANAALTDEVVALAQAAPEFTSWFAWGFALLGDLDRAVEWLGIAAAHGMYADQWVIKSLPDGHALSAHPGYATVIAEMQRQRAEFVASLADEPGP